MVFYKVFSLFVLLFILSISAAIVNAQDIIFEATDCPFRKPAGVTMDCGYLTVPENYAKPDGTQIRLAVAIARHPSGNPEPDPIIYLEGGPGGSPLELLYLTFNYQFETLFNANRDIIIFDQRGVGYSEPALDCPYVQDLNIELLDFELDGEKLSQDKIDNLILDGLIVCGKLLGLDNDLASYNSVSNAADVESLRTALGYEQINLWGISYGTRLALTIMRDYPDAIRSVVIDSVYPPESNLFTEQAGNIDRAFTMLFETCGMDIPCKQSYPNLREIFFETVAELNVNPARFNARNPFTGSIYQDSLFTGDGFVSMIFKLLYDSGSIASLPQLIYQVSEGDYGLSTVIYSLLISQQSVISYGMYFSVECQEELYFNTDTGLDATWALYPELEALAESDDEMIRLCAAYAGTSLDIENQAVASNIPTLLTSGQYDPITPPAWAEQAAQNLSNSLHIEFPHSGHGSTGTVDCPKSIIIDFYINPIPDQLNTACVEKMKLVFSGTIEIETDFVSINLSEYSIPAETIIPRDWEEQDLSAALPLDIVNLPFLGAGMFARGETSLDISSLLFMRIPFISNSDMLINRITKPFHVDPASIVDYESNEVDWKVFPIKAQGLEGFVALTTDNTGSIFIMMLGDESLYTEVLIPVLSAFKFT